MARPDMKPLADPSDDRWLQRGEGHPWARKPGHDRLLIWQGKRPTPRARAARPGATELRSPLLRLRQAHLDRLSDDLRGAWNSAGRCVLHLILPLFAASSGPARSASVAEDHPLRRPLALGRDERRSTLPTIRCRHALDRRQPATHPRRSARLRDDTLCAPALVPAGQSAKNAQQLGHSASVRVARTSAVPLVSATGRGRGGSSRGRRMIKAAILGHHH